MFIFQRSTWPEDPDRAARGGFVIGRTNAGNPIYRNPAASHIIPILPNVLSLIGVLNALWTPEALSRLSEVLKNKSTLSFRFSSPFTYYLLFISLYLLQFFGVFKDPFMRISSKKFLVFKNAKTLISSNLTFNSKKTIY